MTEERSPCAARHSQSFMLFMIGPQGVSQRHLALFLGLRPSEQSTCKPSPDASGIYRVKDGVSNPILIFAPDPEYPDKARRKKLSGTVVVSLTVDAAGKAQDVRIYRSLTDTVTKKSQSAALSLDESAIKTVKQYRFKPAEFEGKPVPVSVKFEVNFRVY